MTICTDVKHVPPGRNRKPGDVCLCEKTRFCNQGWHYVPLELFGTANKNCTECKERYQSDYGMRASVPRRALRVLPADPRFIFVRESHNKKLGPIPTVLVSPETCPPSCGLYGKGCFAEFGKAGTHWRRVEHVGIGFDELLERVSELNPGTVWRYATAGDLPGTGDELDTRMLAMLVEANRGRRGFTFTHKPLRTGSERDAVAAANAAGFTINLSADHRLHAVQRARLGVGPVATLLPEDGDPGYSMRRLVVCPAQTRGLTCSQCQLCTRADRHGIVGFRAHGQMKATVSQIAGSI